MNYVGDRPQVKPSPALVNLLKRIGELKENLGRYEQEASAVLGLKVDLVSLAGDPEPTPGFWTGRQSKKGGFQRVRATVRSGVCFEAWQEAPKREEWSIAVYTPGEWEALCQPTLRLVQWLHEWGGLHPHMELTLQVAVERFQRTGEFSVPLRQDRGGRLCGRCGEEVRQLPEHLKTIHDGPQAQLPLSVYVRVREGRKSVMVEQGGKGRHQHMWTVPEELHRPELKDPRFRAGLANDIDRTFSIAGKSRSFPKNGRFPLPDDITPLPYLAHALRRLTKGDDFSGR